ncbi:unnamed protein product [Paramecium sonneborni]|uniref:Uncharacterized protein n=1 Tax=Paramecium sonneborni TaxID=65129 RepID=A0A8S1RBY8_9CILI|nr:unnamed protein product [Paramecium sonneborni]
MEKKKIYLQQQSTINFEINIQFKKNNKFQSKQRNNRLNDQNNQ